MLNFLDISSEIVTAEHGQYAVIYALADVSTDTYEFTVYNLTTQKYGQYSETSFVFTSDTPVSLTTAELTMPNAQKIHVVRVPCNTLNSDALLLVTITGTATDTSIYKKFISVGNGQVVEGSTTVQVYGYLKDAYGNPIANEPITFTVMNQSSYFDNSPTTSLTAFTSSDQFGRFDINLNRNYNYAMSINKFNYIKVLKIADLPSTANVVEVDVGSGLVC